MLRLRLQREDEERVGEIGETSFPIIAKARRLLYSNKLETGRKDSVDDAPSGVEELDRRMDLAPSPVLVGQRGAGEVVVKGCSAYPVDSPRHKM